MGPNLWCLKTRSPMARLASSSLPKTQGSGPFALMEQTQKKPGIHSLSLEAEKGS